MLILRTKQNQKNIFEFENRKSTQGYRQLAFAGASDLFIDLSPFYTFTTHWIICMSFLLGLSIQCFFMLERLLGCTWRYGGALHAKYDADKLPKGKLRFHTILSNWLHNLLSIYSLFNVILRMVGWICFYIIPVKLLYLWTSFLISISLNFRR